MPDFFAQIENSTALNAIAELAETNSWSALLPEIGTAGLALLVLILEILLPEKMRQFAVNAVFIGLAALIAGVIPSVFSGAAGERILFGGLVCQTEGVISGNLPSTALMRLFFLVSAFFVAWLGARFLKKRHLPVAEFSHLVLIATAAMMLLVQSHHFVLLFVALETFTVGFYVLAGFNRNSGATLEAGVKYLVMGGLSSALLLLGIVLLYGTAGNPLLNGNATGFDALNFTNLAAFIAANPANPLMLTGISLVIGGIAFKIGMFPFQIWVPDVYQGAPTPTTAFLAVSSKAAGIFTLMILLINGAFTPALFPYDNATQTASTGALYILLAVTTGATLVFSNITALGQTNVKRLMGLSGISHAGFLLLGVLAAVNGAILAVPAIVIYLVAYLLGAFATFGVMNELSGENDTAQKFSDYRMLIRRSPFLAGILGIGVGSLAGIPPSLGFVAKFLIIVAAFEASLWRLSAIALICVGAGVYYYFGWLREAFQRIHVADDATEKFDTPIPVPFTSRLILATLATVILLGGITQTFLQIFFQ